MNKTEKKLTPKESAFVEHYVANGNNGTQAVLSSGYKCKDETVAASIAAENLRKPHIAEYLQKLQKPKQEGRLATIEQRRDWLKRAIEGEIYDEHLNKDGEVVAVAPKLADRLKALDLLGRTHGDYSDKLDLTSDGQPIQPTRIIIQAIASKKRKNDD
jgi:phage terminase small subunit